MYYLHEQEIKNLAKEAELFVIEQRKYKHLFQVNEKTKSFIINEDPKILAMHILDQKKIHHLYDDVLRLSKAIQKSLITMDWFNNKC